MLLNIYLGSVVFTNGIVFLVFKAVDKEIKNRGYKSIEKEKNIASSILSLIKAIAITVIPVINVILSISLIAKSNELINKIVEESIDDGSLVKIEDEHQEIEEIQELKKLDNESTVISYNVNNELTREQKIEFLKQELQRLTGKDVVVNVDFKKNTSKQKRR